MDTNTSRKRKQSERKLYLKQGMSKKCHLCVILASILADSEAIHLEHTPLKISNDIPGSEIKISTSDDDEAWLLVFCGIWVAMNTVILLVHQWIITQQPHLV